MRTRLETLDQVSINFVLDLADWALKRIPPSLSKFKGMENGHYLKYEKSDSSMISLEKWLAGKSPTSILVVSVPYPFSRDIKALMICIN